MPHNGPSGVARAARILAYLLMVLAGVVLLHVIPLIPGITDWLWQVMCAWMILGGLAAAAGQLRKRWTGEWIGLPLLIAAMAGFGILQGNLSQWSAEVMPSVALLWSFGLLMYARLRDVRTYYRTAREVAARMHQEPA